MDRPAYRLCLLKVPVSDVVRSSAFYRRTLGFEEQFVAAEYGWAQMTAGDLPVAFYQPGLGGGEAAVGGSVGFHLAVDAASFDVLADRLIPRGVVVNDSIQHGDDGTTYLDLRDPDGNTFRIMRADPSL